MALSGTLIISHPIAAPQQRSQVFAMQFILVLLILLNLAWAANATEHVTEQEPRGFYPKLKKLVGPVPSEPFWNFQTSVWTTHYNPKPEHNNNQDLFGIERHRDDSYMFGAATFRHSFGKRSFYVYTGKRFDFGDSPFFSKVSIGALHGYRGEYKDKIPLNKYGTAPVIIPSVGVNYKMLTSELIFLGNSAAMVTVGLRFGR